MKKTICSRSLMTLLAVLLVTVLLSICTAALSYRQGAGADDNNNPADQTSADTVTTEADMPVESTADPAVTDGDGAAPPDSETTAPGTGEFADDTSNVPDAADPPALNAPSDGTVGDAESALDNIVTDAENAVSDAVDGAEDMVTGTSRFGIWGIVIAIAVIAALSVLLFAMFSRK